MRLTRELCEAVVAGYLLGAGEKPKLNGNGFVERSKHQRRRGRPPKGDYGQQRTNAFAGIGSVGGKDENIRPPMKKWQTDYDMKPAKKRKYTKRSDYWKNPVKS
jgi:hypothetical protein